MAEFRIDDLQVALSSVLKMDAPLGVIRRQVNYIKELHAFALRIPDGHLKKIVWTVEDGYPAHAAGFVQWTVRPFFQGRGCDGTTDGCVHFIAIKICECLGINYAAAYAKAYADTSLSQAKKMVKDIVEEQTSRAEVILPDLPPSRDVIALMLSDLYAINNRSLCEVLVSKLARKGFDVDDFCLVERDLKANYLAALQRLAA